MHKSILKHVPPPAALALAFLVVAAGGAVMVSNASARTPAKEAVELAAQKSKTGGVTVTVKPRDLSGEARGWVFEIVLETHVQDLSDDLTKTAVLVDGAGRQTIPTGWQGDGPGGHHRKGLLSFAPLSPQVDAVELHIRRAGESAPRSFRWKLK